MSPHPSGSLLGLGVLDESLEARLAHGLERVESDLRASVRSDYPFVTEASRHLVDAGGKRFRPLLVLLAAEFGDPRAAGVIPSAVVVELTHLATLYQDDVMDEANLRRGRSVGKRALGQHYCDPDGGLPLREGIQHPRGSRPRCGPHTGADV